MARFALGERLDGDGLFGTGERFFERQFEVVAEIGAAGSVLARAARVHEFAKDGGENVRKAVEAGIAEWIAATAAVLERSLAEAIIGRALLRILEDVIGFADGLEAGFVFLAPAMSVRVAFLGGTAIGSLDCRFVSALLDAKQIVIVLLDH